MGQNNDAMVKAKQNINRNVSLDIMRIVAALAVILVHCSANFIWGYELSTLEFTIGNFLDSVARFGAPLFVMISGALLLDEKKHIDGKSMWAKIKRTLFLIVSWSLLYASINQIYIPWKLGTKIDVQAFISAFIKGHFHMWYLYMMIGLYAAIPFLRYFVKIENSRIVIAFALVAITSQFTSPILTALSVKHEEMVWIKDLISQFEFKFFGGYIAYLLMGWYITHVGFDKKWKKLGIVGIGVLSLIWCFHYVQKTKDFGTAYEYLGLPVFIYSVAVFTALTECKLSADGVVGKMIVKLSSLTFGVYIIHPLIQMDIDKHMKYTDNPVCYMIAYFLIITVISFATSFAISKIPLLKKIVRG